jgi:hypothetical protein
MTEDGLHKGIVACTLTDNDLAQYDGLMLSRQDAALLSVYK